MHSCNSVVIVKGDALGLEAIAGCVSSMLPRMELSVFQNGATALAHLATAPASLAFVGVMLPDMPGMQVVQQVVESRLATRIVLLADRWDQYTAYAAERLRVDAVADVVAGGVAAVVAVLKGFLRRPPDMRPCLSHPPAMSGFIEHLTPREREVFAIIGTGADDKAASTAIGISSRTVHTHRQRIMKKLKVQSRTELMRSALTLGIVTIASNGTFQPTLWRVAKAC